VQLYGILSVNLNFKNKRLGEIRMKDKRFLGLLTAVLIFVTTTVAAYTNTPVAVQLNGTFLDVDAVIIDSRTLAPARAIVEALGGSVSWDAELLQVTIIHEGTHILLTINSSTAYVNNVAVTLDVPPQIINGITKIPVRFASENLGVDVAFHPDGFVILSTATIPAIAPPATAAPTVAIAPPAAPASNSWDRAPGNTAVWTANRTSVVIHSTPNCSNMGSPVETTKSQALARSGGGRPCQRCW